MIEHFATGPALFVSDILVEERKPAELEKFLFEQYEIHTVSIEYENIKGVRITPDVYTTTNLDELVEGIIAFSKG